MKITFLCHGAGNGGAERVITTLASEFSKKGYMVQLVTTNEANNDYKIDTRINRDIVLSNKHNILLRSVDRVVQLRNCIKAFNPECIISFSSIPNMQAVVATLGLNCKVIISERTDPSRYPASLIGKGLRRMLYPLSDKIVFQTNEAKEYFPEHIKRKSNIIPNPIRNDLPEPNLAVSEKRIIGIGSLGEQKNWAMSLEACKIFFEVYPEYTFDIFGEGPYRQELQKIIDKNEILRNRVHLRGFSVNVMEELIKSKMYISSSNYEGISNAMLEALATGIPTICTDCPVGGARENIINGVNGILISVGDSKALSEAMKSVAADEELCKKLSSNSVVIRETLNLDRIVQMWENEVKEICKKQ